MENSKPAVATPSVKRRLISMIYEALLLVAVEALAVFAYLMVTFNAHSQLLDMGRSVVVILTAAAYFIHAWSGSGHTLAMKTWRLKLVMLGHARIPLPVAARRFVFAWGFVAPALIIIHVLGLMTTRAGSSAAMLIVAANIVLWAMTAFLDDDRQFLHDRLAGTRLIELPKRSDSPL